MNKEYNYRRGTLDDLEQLKKLGLTSYGQFKKVLPEDGWKKMELNCGSPDTYIELLKIARCFVCELGNKIIGMAFLIPSGNPFRFFQADWSYIRLIGVDPAHEGKGIGKTLTTTCVNYARESGEKIVALHTSEFQNAARHIYESMGFKKLKALDPIYGKKYWLYTLPLTYSVNNITYYRATQRDINTLIDLRIKFSIELTGEHSLAARLELRDNLAVYFKKAFYQNTAIWYLANDKDTAVGIGGLIFREHPGNFKNPSGKMGYIINMYTLPAFRRKGICSFILNRLVDDANRCGIKVFELHATKKGEYVYGQNGFEIHNEPTYRKYTQ
jgi:GNAT superfamily N-acetyltransferase